ncbi:acyl-phosphate glycerol 3-phosphate acyltransferase [Paenibacillus swuensis]|uniref:Acyl-phosphate glycerol 3-phosphate acyltransferase n=1 Tax=Paenibacillus swuensis TaxID=1178515 RepID=A0A172TLP9_9BACL|nr:lysophospholipid acyltransferase family protein [Paenibacillus swuensis]ANE47985.1 acyl-phosphate glycerol 3-phosphate acyltransferase [Paenibacillus swuensis]
MLYTVLKNIFYFLFKLFYRLEVVGKHHVPAEGPVILCANHISNMDPPLVGTALRRKVHYLAKEELFNKPVIGWAIPKLGAIPVKRGGVSKDAIRAGFQLFKDGKVMGIFPEGTRNSDSSAAKKGAAMFALRTEAAVVPVAIVGRYKLFEKMKIVYGEPMDLSSFKSGGSEVLEEATDAIMNRIREMVKEHQ